jgi:hypothetical protein
VTIVGENLHSVTELKDDEGFRRKAQLGFFWKSTKVVLCDIIGHTIKRYIEVANIKQFARI